MTVFDSSDDKRLHREGSYFDGQLLEIVARNGLAAEKSDVVLDIDIARAWFAEGRSAARSRARRGWRRQPHSGWTSRTSSAFPAQLVTDVVQTAA